MTKRIEIPKTLAVDVLFASNKTCCVCRIERDKVQIHHIDGDRNNNVFANLAVLCLNCHSEAHSTGAFVRGLMPELVARFNESWREVVKLRLLPPGTDPAAKELRAEAYLQTSLDCHGWKIHFMSLAGNNLPHGAPGEFKDVWDLMLELWIPKYSEATYLHYRQLFEEGLLHLQSRLEKAAQLFADVFPPDFRSALVRATRQLETERSTYSWLPMLNSSIPVAVDTNAMFYGRFVGVVQTIRALSRDADARRSELTTDSRGAT